MESMTFQTVVGLVQLVIVVGGGLFFYGKMGEKIDGLRRSVDRQNGTLDKHDERLRTLESQ